MKKSTLCSFIRFAVVAIFVASTNLCFFDCYASASVPHNSDGAADSHCHPDQQSPHHSGGKSSPLGGSICCETSHTFIEASTWSLPTLKFLALDIPAVPVAPYQAIVGSEAAILTQTGADPPGNLQSRIFSALISAPNAPPAISFS